MKTVLLASAVLCWCINTFAQTTFEKYYLTGASATMTLSELSSGNLFTGIGCSGTSIMDPQGNIIHIRCYEGMPFLVLQSVRKFSDNEIFFVGGYLQDSCNVAESLKVDPVIGKMDSLGNIVAMKRYVLNAVTCLNNAQGLEITSEKGIVATGRAESFFALRVDSLGTPLWSKQFPYNGSFSFIRELPGGDLLAGINMDTAGAAIARLDANGNFIWCKSYIRPKGLVHDCYIESDSSFIIAGYTDSIGSTNGFGTLPPDYHPKLFMMKLNGTGNVQWCKGYDSEPKWYAPEPLRIVTAQDGNYVVLANIGIQDHNLPYRPFLMKTDQNGDTMWTRSAGVYGYSYVTASLLAGSDGGFYYDGGAYGDFGLWSGAAFLFKADSMGHLPCSEAPPPPIIVSDLFPVDSSFTLTSEEGAIGFSVTISDVMNAPIVTYDGCTITSTPRNNTERKFQAYPNPNTGHFTVQFNDPLMAESYYSVYDTMGRLLLQRPLPTGATLAEVDLSRFGKGTYVIKFTDKEGVCYERVVVE